MGPLLEGAGNIPQQAFAQWNDPHGNKLISINRDGTISCLGLNGGAAVAVNDPIAVAAGLSGAIQTVRQAIVLTAADILLGYKEAHIDWPYPWPDLNETTAYAVCNPDQTDGTDFAPGTTYGRTLEGINVILNLTAAVPIVQGQYDNFNTSSALTYSFTPLTTGMYALSQYLHPKSGQAISDLAAIETIVNYTGEGTDGPLVLQPATMVTTCNGPVADDESPIYAMSGQPISISTVFTTYALAGTVPTTIWFVTGSFTGTQWAYGTTINQVGGATAYFYGTFNNGGLAIIYRMLTGVDNGGNWSQGGTTFTVTGSPTQPSGNDGFLYGPGASLQQQVTGATASELDGLVGTGVQHIGPGITGGTADASHAWIDTVTGGVLVPSAAPALIPFAYHFSIRVVQMPSNQTIYQPGQLTYLNLISIHD